jgi:SAM-dependent methyltransferase
MSDASLYDEIPYPGRAFAQTHPDRLATMATLFGLDPAPPSACRVLELGCGDGGNILPMALGLPGSSFVGIDLAPLATERARALADLLHLENIEFEHVGIEDYDAPDGSFDYVIAHGVFSWVPERVRDDLLALCARLLTPHGVAYVSYNAMPGQRTRQTLRDMLAFALDGIDEPAARMAAARELLAEACTVWQAGEGLEATIGGQARMLLGQGEALFFHDTLSPVNKALYVHEFVAHAGEHGLQFLAEAEFSEMQIGGLPQDLQRQLLEIDDIVRREQILDFLNQRMFRQTLLCHAGLNVDGVPRPERIATLAASGPIETTTGAETDRVTFTATSGSHLSTAHPLVVRALQRIADRWPAAVWIDELAGGDGASDEDREVVCEALLPCFAANLVRLHAHPPRMATTPGPRPHASPLARLQALERDRLTTLRHTSIRLEDDFGWRLVALLDGTRDRGALLTELRAGLGGGYDELEADLDRSLATLARVALLIE